MKKSAVVRVIIYSVLIIVLLGFLLTGIGLRAFSVISGSKGSDHTAEAAEFVSYQSAGIPDSIQIQWAAGNIRIEHADVDTIQATSTDDQFKVNASGNTLEISSAERKNFFGLFSSEGLRKDLTVLVPMGWDLNKLTVNSAAADIVISQLNIRSAELDAASGEIIFTDCHVEDLTINCASGNCAYSGTLERLTMDGASAGLQLNVANYPKSIIMNSAAGKAELTLPQDCAFDVSMDSLSAKFESEFDTEYTDGHHTHNGECHRAETGDFTEISISGMSCSLTIHKGTAHS